MSARPDFIGHWTQFEDADAHHSWIDGELFALQPGDSVAFPAGTGICHTFLNNRTEEVRLLVVGEKPKPENRIRYPLNLKREASGSDRWDDPPERVFGPHDGRPHR